MGQHHEGGTGGRTAGVPARTYRHSVPRLVHLLRLGIGLPATVLA